MKKVLITGGSGLLGQYLNVTVSSRFRILTTYKDQSGSCTNFPNSKIDIRKNDELQKLFEEFNPEIVIHTAAITNPIQKENQSAKEYFDTNVKATENIAILCQVYKAKLIYISTDLVYAGYRGSFLKEDAKLIPATLYAETKLVGESKVLESTNNYLILRTALLYGLGLNHTQSHFHQMFKDLQNNKPVNLFIDQFRTPISLIDAAKIITDLSDMDLPGEIINLGGFERVSRYVLGEILCSVAGFDKNLLQKITMDEINGFPKVEDVSLNTEKLQSLKLKSRSIEENIRELVANLK